MDKQDRTPGMTAQQLIRFLSGFDPDTEVRISVPLSPTVDAHRLIDRARLAQENHDGSDYYLVLTPESAGDR